MKKVANGESLKGYPALSPEKNWEDVQNYQYDQLKRKITGLTYDSQFAAKK